MKSWSVVFFLLLALFVNDHAFASERAVADSLRYKWIKGQKFILHKVGPKETWTSVARKYQISISDLMKSNLGVVDLKTGQILNVPVSPKEAVNDSPKLQEEKTLSPPVVDAKSKTAILYTVHASETLYGISKKFNVSVEDLKKWNNLKSDTLKEGQKLVVSYFAESEKPKNDSQDTPDKFLFENKKSAGRDPDSKIMEEAVKKESEKSREPVENEITEKRPPAASREIPQDVAKTNDTSGKVPQPETTLSVTTKTIEGKKIKQITETGNCSWVSGADTPSSRFFALHRSAPVGTIIKVTNKMNNRYVYVKVIGVLPDTGDNENIILKVSESAVQKMGALDNRFLVALEYGIPQ